MNEIVNKIIENGYEAYIVGGYVRDYLLGITSKDIDICTNAKIEDIIRIFNNKGKAFKEYYSFHIEENGFNYDITTYRKELEYKKNKPIKLEIADNLKTDLLRRDFTINTFAIDSEFKLVDLLNAKVDLDAKIIRTVGDAYLRFNEDKTRILRALRFACTLDFELDDDINKFFLEKKGYLLNEVTKEYKRKEMDKIFDSNNYDRFFYLVKKYDISKYLNIKFDTIKKVYNKYGVWSQIDTNLPFSNKEKIIISGIKELISKNDITYFDYKMYNKDVLYNAACILKKSGKLKLYDRIDKLHSMLDIDIDIDYLIREVGESNCIRVYKKIEESIIKGELSNDRSEIEFFIEDKYYE